MILHYSSFHCLGPRYLQPSVLPYGSKCQNLGASRPKYYRLNGLWDLKPQDLSPWTFRASSKCEENGAKLAMRGITTFSTNPPHQNARALEQKSQSSNTRFRDIILTGRTSKANGHLTNLGGKKMNMGPSTLNPKT